MCCLRFFQDGLEPNTCPVLLIDSSFMCHPEMLLHIPTIDDPVERFVSVVKFYLSGWHIRPPFVQARPGR